MARRKYPEFFDELEVGDQFRYKVPWGSDPERFSHIHCTFYGFDQHSGLPHYYYFEHGVSFEDSCYRVQWKKKEHADHYDLERWVPHITLEDQRTMVYTAMDHGDYEPSGWTFADLEGSTWVNRWTFALFGDCEYGIDRFGKVQLFSMTRDGKRSIESLGSWHDDEEHGRIYGIYHEMRYDTMTQAEQVEVAEWRIAKWQDEATCDRYCGGPNTSAGPELERAKAIYRELTGSVVPHHIVNAGTQFPDQPTQLELFG